MNDFDTVKISDFENANRLSEFDLKESVVPIVINDKNYKLKLGERFYTEKEIDNQINELSIRIDKKLYGLDIEDSIIHTKLNELNTHISALKDGALVDASIQVSPSSDAKGYKDIYTVANILYTPLTYDKVLISSNKGKVSASEISTNELNALKGWNLTDNNGKQISIADKVKELETIINGLLDLISVQRLYFAPTYKTTERLDMNNKEYIAKNDGILSVIPYYSRNMGVFDIYINNTFVTQTYQCYGDGHSHSGCCIPVKKDDIIKFKKVTGSQSEQKAYLIY